MSVEDLFDDLPIAILRSKSTLSRSFEYDLQKHVHGKLKVKSSSMRSNLNRRWCRNYIGSLRRNTTQKKSKHHRMKPLLNKLKDHNMLQAKFSIFDFESWSEKFEEISARDILKILLLFTFHIREFWSFFFQIFCANESWDHARKNAKRFSALTSFYQNFLYKNLGKFHHF